MEEDMFDTKQEQSFEGREQFISNLVAEILDNHKNTETGTQSLSLRNGINTEPEFIPFTVISEKYVKRENTNNTQQNNSVSTPEISDVPVDSSEDSNVNSETNIENMKVQDDIGLKIEKVWSANENLSAETFEDGDIMDENYKIQFLQQMDSFFVQAANPAQGLDSVQDDGIVTENPVEFAENKMNSKSPVNKSKSSFRCKKCKKSFKLRILLNKHKCVTEKKKKPENETKSVKKYCTRPRTKTKKMIEYSTKLTKKNKAVTDNSTNSENKTNASNFNVNESLIMKVEPVTFMNGLYSCSVCGKSFSNKGSVRRHMKYHTGRVHPCVTCEKVFSCASELVKHSRVHTNERPFKCEVCNKTFKNSSHLNSHKLLHFDSRKYQCTECDKTFVRKESLVRHRKYHTGDVLLCPDCGKSFASQGELKIHRLTHGNERPFVCEVCGSSFKRSTNYRSHQKIHMAKQIYSCSVCEKGFEHMSSLRRHMKYHIGCTFSCNVCSKQFSCNSEYEKHKTVHSNERQYHCEICNKSFKLPNHLKSHYKVHTGAVAEHLCKDCGKKFVYHYSLIRHQKRLCFLKNNTCSICAQQFEEVTLFCDHFGEHTYEELKDLFGRTNNSLTNCNTKAEILEQLKKVLTTDPEESDHSEDAKMETYQCELCEKIFQHKDSLRRHQRFHEGKYLMCNICGKQCSCVSELEKHRLIHFPEEPFECDVCEKKLKSIERLKTHKLNSHTPQVCEEPGCGLSFSGRSALHRHKKCRHSDKERKSHEIQSSAGKKVQSDSSDDSELELDFLDDLEQNKSESNDSECVVEDFDSSSPTSEDAAHPEVEEKLRRSPGQAEDSAFYCHHCNKAFWEASFLENHIKTKHQNMTES